ncbi:YadA-like family protein [Paraburkholderia sp. LEh10]|uniref:YadA family autotransporter adhesin n=1 Tax=Paraburkholderia sp. LEh10 TaxID=2821353 RepID=UPI001AE912E8|nr:YadA-like family protein [Paraburkholderia sp. LEh10]MBP0595548.1 YadA-like family protein [Paraburkholderia sp. LEh10]
MQSQDNDAAHIRHRDISDVPAAAARLIAGIVMSCSMATTAHASVLAGNGAVSIDATGIAVGDTAFAGGVDSVAIGDTSTATGNNATAFGAHARAMAGASTALGDTAQANAFQSLALGANSMATFANSIALGSGSVTLFGAQIGYTAFGLSTPQTSSGEVNVGNRTISTLAPGRADQDAVNVAQLKAVSNRFDGELSAMTKRVDGAVMYDRNGDDTINYDSITLRGNSAAGGTQIHNLADAVDAHDAVNLGQLTTLLGNAVGNVTVQNVTLNTSNPLFSAEGTPSADSALASGAHSIAAGAHAQAGGTNAVAFGTGSNASVDNAIALGAAANASASNSVALGAGSNASADNSVALGQGSVADRASTVSVGAAGQERQIANVAAGVAGTDAVNVNQLGQSMNNAVGQAKTYTDDQVRSARKDGYGGAAAAIAMAGLPQAVLPGRGMVALSAGTYGGQSAMALGVSQLSDTGKWVYKLQGTASTRGELGASIGAGMHW